MFVTKEFQGPGSGVGPGKAPSDAGSKNFAGAKAPPGAELKNFAGVNRREIAGVKSQPGARFKNFSRAKTPPGAVPGLEALANAKL